MVNLSKVQPMLNEKSYRNVGVSKFTFSVPRTGLNKIELKKVIEKQYKVNVTSINLVNKPGKLKRIGVTRNFRRTSPVKKMIVSLKKGQTIEGFSLN